MVTTTNTSSLTVNDLIRMPDDDFRCEPQRGSWFAYPCRASRTGPAWVLAHCVYDREWGEITGAVGAYILSGDPQTVRIPDLSFVRTERLPPVEEWSRFLAVASDLVVEVVSPSDTVRYMFDTVAEYPDAGIRLFWIVKPLRHTVMVYLPDRSARLLLGADVLDGGDILPGFQMPSEKSFG